MKIKDISAIEILDSRGNPTVQSTIILENGQKYSASVPSGASTGVHEATELRDKDRFFGKGVQKAVDAVLGPIREAVCGMHTEEQKEIDNTMIMLDGTENKSKLGANSILSVSIAAARAAAGANNMELYRYLGGATADIMPLPMMNILNGGEHANNNIDIQEFMIVPTGAQTFSQGLFMCTKINMCLKKYLKEKGISVAVGDEGGVAPDLEDEREAIELIMYATQMAGYTPGKEIKIALDAASSGWYKEDGLYVMPKSGRTFYADELIKYWDSLISDYPIISVEDPASEDDWDLWQKITMRLSRAIQIVGDDLFVTNTDRISHGIDIKASNAVLIKPNQIGTLTETIAAVKLAMGSGMGTIISHRSGETEDTFIADLAVGLGAGQIKTGAPCRGERTAKYNRLLNIEAQICGNYK